MYPDWWSLTDRNIDYLVDVYNLMKDCNCFHCIYITYPYSLLFRYRDFPNLSFIRYHIFYMHFSIQNLKDILVFFKYGKMIRGKQVTLHFKICRLKRYGKMIRGKQVTLHFKRCRLEKYGKMIRRKQITLHFKRCDLQKYGKMIRGKWNVFITSSTRKTSFFIFVMFTWLTIGSKIIGVPRIFVKLI